MSSRLLEILRQLSHDEFQSGEAIAARLGCSRATVHNAVSQGVAAGLEVHAVKGRGYRLGEPVSWLDPAALAASLAAQGLALEYADVLESTNTHLLATSQDEARQRIVALAEWQTGGRGRRGRQWHAGLGGGLQFSLRWRSALPASGLSGLSLAVGVVLVQVLRDMGLAGAAVKWPNDILLDGAKLAGVLIELGGDMLGPSTVVIGVGVNVLGAARLREQVGQPVTDLGEHLGAVDRNALFLRLVSALDQGLRRFEAAGFAAFRQAWQDCHAFQGQAVRLTGMRDEVVGRALGVDEQGALLLETEAGVLSFHSGEVSLRGLAP